MAQSSSMVENVFDDYREDKVTRKAAAIAFFAVLAIAPTIVVSVLVIQWVMGDSFTAGQLADSLSRFVGRGNAQAIDQAVAAVQSGGWVTGAISFLSLALAMVSVVRMMRESLNEIFGLDLSSQDDPEDVVKRNVRAFFIVMGVGIVLVLFVGTGTWAGSLGANAQGGFSPVLGYGLNLVVAAVVATLVYAVVYKYIPDVHVDWKNTWAGAAIAGVLFSIGTLLVSWYISSSTAMESSYGMFGSMVIVLVWVFYSTVMMLIGAEFVQQRAHDQIRTQVAQAT